MKSVIFFMMIVLNSYAGAAQLPACFYQIERDFFSYSVVTQAFSNSNIPQAVWPVLYNQINQNAQYVHALVEQGAARMNPNPLNPYQPLLAGELLKRVLFKVFHDTMLANRTVINNRVITESDINQMFIYIRSQQSLLLSGCFGVESEADQRVTE